MRDLSETTRKPGDRHRSLHRPHIEPASSPPNDPPPFVGVQLVRGLPLLAWRHLYCGGGEPSFPAALGSIYMRTGGSGEGLLYVNTDGVAAWQPFA
jgi:hypothetical protein